jgi:hypothetical protein
MIIRGFFAAMLLCVSLLASAQQAAIGNSIVGTIQRLEQHNGSVTISSQNYGYDESMFQVFYDGSVVPFTILDEGIVVRFYVNRESMITRMELLGPIDRIREFFEN